MGRHMEGSAMLERLVTERYGRLLSYARLLMPERADAEDVVHEALIATFSRTRRFDHLDACESYVRRAIASRGIDEHRRRGRERRAVVSLRSDALETVASPEQSVVDVTSLTQALATLSPRERACVTLRFVDHMSVAETAAVLSLAQGTVKRYVSDGIAKLNAQLGTAQATDEVTVIDVISRESAR